MKKYLVTISSLLLLITTSLLLVACTNEEFKPINNNVGATMPNVNVKNSINNTMTAMEMYNQGVANYYDVGYVGTFQSGDIVTKVGLETIQGLDIIKVRDNGLYYMSNHSATKKEILGVNIKLMEETVIDGDNVKYRNTKDCAYNKDSILVANSWGETVKYSSHADLLVAKPNDPARMNMYIVNSDTIKSATAPEFDKKTKQYTFTLTMDAASASKDYDAVVKQTLDLSGFANASVTYNTLSFQVTMWENGLIRNIVIDESYKIKSFVSGTCKMKATINYTYDNDELPINKLIKF